MPPLTSSIRPPPSRGPFILHTVDKWIEEAAGDSGHRSRLTDLRRQLKEEFDKLGQQQ